MSISLRILKELAKDVFKCNCMYIVQISIKSRMLRK